MTKGKFPLYFQIIIVALVAGYFIFAEFATAQQQDPPTHVKPPPPRISPGPPPRIRPPPPIRIVPAPRPRVGWTDAGVDFAPYFDPTLQVTVSENAGHIEWDCAHADLETAVADGQGGFVATGTYTQEHMGPTHPGEDNTTRALFVGVVKGAFPNDQLTLTLTTYLKTATQTVLNLNHKNNRRPFKCK